MTITHGHGATIVTIKTIELAAAVVIAWNVLGGRYGLKDTQPSFGPRFAAPPPDAPTYKA